MPDQYRWKKGRWELGPASLEDMRKMVRSGSLSRAQGVSIDGGKSWAPAGEFPEIWDVVSGAEPSEPRHVVDSFAFGDHDEPGIDVDTLLGDSGGSASNKMPSRTDGGLAIAGFSTATVSLVLLTSLALLWVLRLISNSWVIPASFVLLIPAIAGIVLSSLAISRWSSGLAKAGIANGICGGLFGLALAIAAIGSHSVRPSEVGASPSTGQADTENAGLAPEPRKSLFQQTTYRMRAVLVDKDQRPVPLESMSVYACPKSIAQKQLRPAIAQHQQEVKDWDNRLQALSEKLEKTKSRLADEETTVAKEYDVLRPKEGTGDVLALRNPLKDLSKARASKSKADEWYEQAISNRIEPIKGEIATTEQAIKDSLNQQRKLQADLRDRVFKAICQVADSQKKTWKTGKDGFVSIEVSATEPWTVWAVAEHEKYIGKNIAWSSHAASSGGNGLSSSGKIESRDIVQKKQVRWIIDIPDELDNNNLLTLDLETAFDAFVVSVDSSAEDGPYLRKQRVAQ